MASSRKTIGDLGEILTTFFLIKQGFQTVWVGNNNLPYDIIVPLPDEKISQKPIAISVKTRQKKKWKGVPPNENTLKKLNVKLKEWDFWIAVMLYGFKKNEMWFKIYLIPSEIITEDWFVGKKRQISFKKIKMESKKPKTKIRIFTSKNYEEPTSETKKKNQA